MQNLAEWMVAFFKLKSFMWNSCEWLELFNYTVLSLPEWKWNNLSAYTYFASKQAPLWSNKLICWCLLSIATYVKVAGNSKILESKA